MVFHFSEEPSGEFIILAFFSVMGCLSGLHVSLPFLGQFQVSVANFVPAL